MNWVKPLSLCDDLECIVKKILSLCIVLLLVACANTKETLGTLQQYNPLKSTKPEMSHPVQVNVQPVWATKAGRGAGRLSYEFSPVVKEDIIYTVDRRGVFSMLDKQTGRMLAQHGSRMKVTSNLAVDDEGKAYAANDKGEIFAIAVETGEIAWQTPVNLEILAQPQLTEKFVIATTLKGGLYVLDKATGELQWEFAVASPMMIERRTNPPLVVNDTIYAGLANGKILAFNVEDGEILWERKVSIPEGIGEVGNLIDIDTQPLLWDDALFVKTYQREIIALNKRTGEVLWKHPNIPGVGMLVEDAILYVVGRRGGVWALDTQTGHTKWESPALEERFLAAPVMMDEYIVLGDSRGYLLWLSKQAGQLEGYHRLARRPITTAPIVEGNTLYVQNAYGKLGAYQVERLNSGDEE